MTGTFSFTGRMNDPLTGRGSTILPDGTVLIVGGEFQTITFATAEVYDPGTGMFTRVGSMSIRRHSHTVSLLPDGRVLVAGGGGQLALAKPWSYDTAEIYDPATGTFSMTGRLSTTRAFHTATLLGCGLVLVTGGVGEFPAFSTPRSSAELYNPQTGVWTPTAEMSTARNSHAGTLLLSGQVLVVGGTSQVSTERFGGACPPCSE